MSKLKEKDIKKIIKNITPPKEEGLHYVYVHINSKGEVFYIGKGIGSRMLSGFRNRAWMNEFNNSEYLRCVKLYKNISNEEAKRLEKEIIVLVGKDNLANKKSKTGNIKAYNFITNKFKVCKNYTEAIKLTGVNEGQIYSVMNYCLPYSANWIFISEHDTVTDVEIAERLRLTKLTFENK